MKLRAAGSTAKHTAIRRRRGEGSDADVAAYVRASSVGGIDADESGLLDWLRDRCIEVYGATKDAEDFVISEHAVGITMRGSGLKIDVAPVLYEGAPDDCGHLITRQGDRVLTSVTLHLAFIRARRDAAGPNYRELIRLLKAWIREAKRNDTDLRCKSFLLELIVAHLWDQGWNGEPLAVDDYPRAFEQVLGYIARTGLRTPIIFTDFYTSDRGDRDQRPDPGLGPGQPGEQRRPHLHRGRPAAPGQDGDHRAGGDRLGRAGAHQGRRQRRLAERARPGIRGGMMTATGTRTATFTITDARYVGAKIGADLRLLNSLYGRPSLVAIGDFAEEAALLLRDGYLAHRRLRVPGRGHELVEAAAPLHRDHGRLPPQRPPRQAPHRGRRHRIPLSQLPHLHRRLPRPDVSAAGPRSVTPCPFSGSEADEPVTGLGTSQSGHGYGRNGAGVTRDVFTAFGIEEQ